MIPVAKFPLGLLDRAAEVVREDLYANDALRVWSQGRVYRDHAGVIPRPGTLWPSIYVSVGTDRPEPQVGCSDLFFSIQVWLVWYLGPTLGENDPSIASVVSASKAVLLANDQLVSASGRFDGLRQADKMTVPHFDPIEYEGSVEVDGKFVMVRNFAANYVYKNLPSDTLEPAA